jgi:hypothetical protein
VCLIVASLLVGAGSAWAQSSKQIEVGLFVNSHWTTAQPPVSVPYIFGVRCSRQPSAASFVATAAVTGTVRSMSASICPITWNLVGQPVEWLAYTPATTGDVSALNQTWHVVCTLTTWVPPSGPPPWPNQWITETASGDVFVKNLAITSGSIGASPGDPPIQVVDDEPFVTVVGPGTALWQESVDDGTELPAAQTALGVFDLVPLVSEYNVHAEVTGVPPVVFQCEVGVPWDGAGLYYRKFSVGETGQGYPQSIDGTASLSGISVTGVQRYHLEVTAPQTVRAGMRITIGGPAGSPLADAKHRWYAPDGALTGAGGGVPPETAGSMTDVMLDEHFMPLAGAWTFAAAYRDTLGDHYHEGSGKWTRPGCAQISIPAEAVFADAADPILGGAFLGLGSDHEAALRLLPADPVAGYVATFYAGRPVLGVRGGLVQSGTKAVALAALQDDQVVAFAVHGWNDYVNLTGSASLSTSDVAGLPGGALSQACLVWFSACGTMGGGPTSLAMAVSGKGAQAVVGYLHYTYPEEPGFQMFESRAWDYLRLGQPVCQAISLARTDALVAGYGLAACGVDDNPATSDIEGVTYTGASVRIAPAW